MEVERYTLATGETAITGFTRLWKPWWFLFIIMLWFGYFSARVIIAYLPQLWGS